MDDESKGAPPERPDGPLGDHRLDWQDPEYRGLQHRVRRSADKPMTLKRRWRRVRRRMRRRGFGWPRARTIAIAIVALVVLTIIAAFGYVAIDLVSIDRLNILPDKAGPAGQGQNILIVGSEVAPPKVDAATLDVQLVHISGDATSAYVIDIPRDLALPGGGTIADALQGGGVKAVGTAVQSLVQVNLNHAVEVDFKGYAAVTDDVGGVLLDVGNGKQVLDGATMEKIASDPNPPGRTIDTGRRYQAWVKAMMVSGLRPGLLLNPFKLLTLTDHATGNIAVENGFGSLAMVGSVWGWRDLGPGQIHFFTIPQKGYTTKGPSVLTPDATAIEQLGTALRSDNLSAIGVFMGH